MTKPTVWLQAAKSGNGQKMSKEEARKILTDGGIIQVRPHSAHLLGRECNHDESCPCQNVSETLRGIYMTWRVVENDQGPIHGDTVVEVTDNGTFYIHTLAA